MRVAMAQISSTDDPTANLETVRAVTADAASRGAELVVFPEATMCRFGVPLKLTGRPGTRSGPKSRCSDSTM